MSREIQRRNSKQRLDDGWVDSMVEVAKVCNNLFTKQCNLCNVYTNKQVEFEWRQERTQNSDSSSPVQRALQKVNRGNLEVHMYRQFLFDEESVIAGASLREDDTSIQRMGSQDGERSVLTHGTN
ncbi:hypothetical protein FisN_30Lh074 [Fistulifera solaris]|uniref:Uncharacterized protein n=1 Tax=Fistulifera solaris TaxID=1519565 RepID=A0A1Z5JIG0_FISSO|nr:hypothetical protein FisN_30Lh074 [Fistulifera solaris]|eukprot:GAX13779.1 hypothetical protein FisN_30Lh074 [Fistulifera solaris]